jgi:ribosomal protein S18 acetylase RimI-like enzyme
MKNIKLRRATANDVDTFLALEKSVIGPKTYSGILEKDEAEKEMAENIVYLIEADNLVVGSIQYVIERDGVVYLSGIVIDPNYQGQGIAKQATEILIKEIGDVKKIHLATHPHNIPAIKLFLSFGFIIDGWKDDYFSDGEPRIVMVKVK